MSLKLPHREKQTAGAESIKAVILVSRQSSIDSWGANVLEGWRTIERYKIQTIIS
jgi:hypothetical protein